MVLFTFEKNLNKENIGQHVTSSSTLSGSHSFKKRMTAGEKIFKKSLRFMNDLEPSEFKPELSKSIKSKHNNKILYSYLFTSYNKSFDVLGKEIEILVNEAKPAGNFQVEFKAANLPSGVYFYRIQAGRFVETRKMILMK
jgi:hypothetical protein